MWAKVAVVNEVPVATGVVATKWWWVGTAVAFVKRCKPPPREWYTITHWSYI